MTGEQLYHLWRESSWEVHLDDPGPWAELSAKEREVWNTLAEKLEDE